MSSFNYIDLFAGIGGFHLAMEGLGGTCVFASEIDGDAQSIYVRNHLQESPAIMHGDIIPLTEPSVARNVPDHDLLAAGFPCQPFSKGGYQHGINEARGTLFFNIASIIEARRPKFFILENVRNLIGPRHRDTWIKIHQILTQDLGYWVSSTPTILSPHLLPASLGGTPQVRERIYIVGIRQDLIRRPLTDSDWSFQLPKKPIATFDPQTWDAYSDLFLPQEPQRNELSDERRRALDIWGDFLKEVGVQADARTLPGFPIWEWALKEIPDLNPDYPGWKNDFLVKNSNFYRENRGTIDAWRLRNPEVRTLSNSYRKFEWQAGSLNSLDKTLIQFRPSGIRVKKATYLPALVAMNQTSYVPGLGRYLSVREAAKLQGFPPDFDFGDQTDGLSFKQLGNAVCVGVVQYALTQTLKHFDLEL